MPNSVKQPNGSYLDPLSSLLFDLRHLPLRDGVVLQQRSQEATDSDDASGGPWRGEARLSVPPPAAVYDTGGPTLMQMLSAKRGPRAGERKTEVVTKQNAEVDQMKIVTGFKEESDADAERAQNAYVAAGDSLNRPVPQSRYAEAEDSSDDEESQESEDDGPGWYCSDYDETPDAKRAAQRAAKRARAKHATGAVETFRSENHRENQRYSSLNDHIEEDDALHDLDTERDVAAALPKSLAALSFDGVTTTSAALASEAQSVRQAAFTIEQEEEDGEQPSTGHGGRAAAKHRSTGIDPELGLAEIPQSLLAELLEQAVRAEVAKAQAMGNMAANIGIPTTDSRFVVGASSAPPSAASNNDELRSTMAQELYSLKAAVVALEAMVPSMLQLAGAPPQTAAYPASHPDTPRASTSAPNFDPASMKRVRRSGSFGQHHQHGASSSSRHRVKDVIDVHVVRAYDEAPVPYSKPQRVVVVKPSSTAPAVVPVAAVAPPVLQPPQAVLTPQRREQPPPSATSPTPASVRSNSMLNYSSDFVSTSITTSAVKTSAIPSAYASQDHLPLGMPSLRESSATPTRGMLFAQPQAATVVGNTAALSGTAAPTATGSAKQGKKKTTNAADPAAATKTKLVRKKPAGSKNDAAPRTSRESLASSVPDGLPPLSLE